MPSRPEGAAATFLCFDFGLRYIGVAVGQGLTATASPLDTLTNPSNGGVDWQQIAQLIEQWQPDALVVGIPLREDGQQQKMTAAAERFGRRLHGRYGLAVHHADERFSSKRAQQRFRTLRRSGDVARQAHRREHAVAAQLILEDWLEAHLT